MLALRESIGLANNLGYYVDGTEHAATALKLKLYVNEPIHEVAAQTQFIEAARSLVEQALGPGTVQMLADDLAALTPFQRELPNGRVALTREIWPEHRRNGYELALQIARGIAGR